MIRWTVLGVSMPRVIWYVALGCHCKWEPWTTTNTIWTISWILSTFEIISCGQRGTYYLPRKTCPSKQSFIWPTICPSTHHYWFSCPRPSSPEKALGQSHMCKMPFHAYLRRVDPQDPSMPHSNSRGLRPSRHCIQWMATTVVVENFQCMHGDCKVVADPSRRPVFTLLLYVSSVSLTFLLVIMTKQKLPAV